MEKMGGLITDRTVNYLKRFLRQKAHKSPAEVTVNANMVSVIRADFSD